MDHREYVVMHREICDMVHALHAACNRHNINVPASVQLTFKNPRDLHAFRNTLRMEAEQNYIEYHEHVFRVLGIPFKIEYEQKDIHERRQRERFY